MVKAAERGEKVFLKRNSAVVAQIVPVPEKEMPFGYLKGEIGPIDDSLLFGSEILEVPPYVRLAGKVAADPELSLRKGFRRSKGDHGTYDLGVSRFE